MSSPLLLQWVWGSDEALDGLRDALWFTVSTVCGQRSSWQRDRVSVWLSEWPPWRNSFSVWRPHRKRWNIQRYTRTAFIKNGAESALSTFMQDRKLTSTSRDVHIRCVTIQFPYRIRHIRRRPATVGVVCLMVTVLSPTQVFFNGV